MDVQLCMSCFYNYRTSYEGGLACGHSNKVKVKWNNDYGRYESTTIRPFPASLPPGVKKGIAMCDPTRGNCRRDKCTFAHGRVEQKTWNTILRSRQEQEELPKHQVSRSLVCQPPFGFNPTSYHYLPPPPPSAVSPPAASPLQPWPDLMSPTLQSATIYQPVYQPPQNLYTPTHPGQELVSYHQPTPRVQRAAAERYAASSETFEGRLRGDLEIEEIEVELTRETYKRKFHHLICWEEKEHIDILGNKCDTQCDVVLFEEGVKPDWIQPPEFGRLRYGFLKNIGADRIAYATQASEGAFIVSRDGNSEVKLEILKENFRHSDENMYVAFNQIDKKKLSSIVSPQSLSSREVSLYGLFVQFEVKHYYFNSLIKSVTRISPEIIKRILPSPGDFLPFTSFSEDFFQSLLLACKVDLDPSQLKALRIILTCNCRSPPVIVNGSFGTGKTQLLAAVTFCVIKEGITTRKPVRVLICAHHQASADHFMESYFIKMFGDKMNVELVRLYSRLYHGKNNWSLSCNDYIKSYQLNHQRHSDYLIVVTTFNTAPNLLMKFKVGHFTHILIDEGSQAREPDAIAPLRLAGVNTKLVIAGDSCQVGPSLLVLGDEARENGLKYSLQERLQDLYKKQGVPAVQHLVSLNTNYRCHKELVKIPNNLFYQSKIQSRPKDATPHPQAKFPMIFVCSSLTAEEDNSGLEAQLLLEQVKKFVTAGVWPTSEWGPLNLRDICVATASQTQLVVTRTWARKKFTVLQNIRMLTTFTIQGEEFRAVFLSTIEPVDGNGNTTNPTKSPCDPYVFNTVLTRSKSLVVVVGNPLALLKIEQHMVKQYGKKAQCWSSYLRVCLEKNSFIIPPQLANLRAKESMLAQLQAKLQITLGSSHLMKPSLSQSAPSSAGKTTRLHPASPSVLVKHPGLERTSQNVEVSCRPHETRSNRVMAPHENRPSQAQSMASTTQKVGNARPHMSSPKNERLGNVRPHMASNDRLQRADLLAVSRNATMKVSNPSVAAISNHQVPKAASAGPGQRMSQANSKEPPASKPPVSNYDEKDFPSLNSSQKISKKKGKQMAEKEQRTESISAQGVSVPSRHSQFYEQYKDKLESESHILKEDLKPGNYREKFHHLLSWEEKEHDRQLSERCNNVYDIVVFQKGFTPTNVHLHKHEIIVRFGYITSEDSDTLSHAKQASEGSFIILDNKSVVHADHVQGTVPNSANFSAILLAFNEEENGKLKSSKYFERGQFSFRAKVNFELKHSYFSRLHAAIKYVPMPIIHRLLPGKEQLQSAMPLKYYQELNEECEYSRMNLDEMQLNALRSILSSSPSLPVLVAGPFGTGKTRLLARTAFEMLKDGHRRILICAHHQASVDTFVEYFGATDISMIRIIPYQSYRSKTRDKFGSCFKTKKAITGKDLANNQLIITTLGMAVALFHVAPGENPDAKRRFFSDILIDEAAQTREPETISPLSLANADTKIIIAGDHCQVGPKLLVLGEEAQSNGLGMSLLERLHKIYDKVKFTAKKFHSVHLLTNHRCHSGVLMLPSSLYYHSTLMCRVPDSIAHRLAPFPLAFVCSDIKQDIKRTSGINENEADVLIREVQKYFTHWPKHWDDKDRRICIMSPSADQCNLLRKKVRSLKKPSCTIEVLKAYEIQGTEFRAIFISSYEPTTEDGDPINKTKSICDRFVFNTALTRSRSLVVVVGNPFILLKMEENMVKKNRDPSYRTWTPFIKQCIECKTFSYGKSVRKSDPSTFIEATHNLYSIVHSESAAQELNSSTQTLDSIIKSYKRVFERLPECKGIKMVLAHSTKSNRLTWSIEDGRSVENGERRAHDEPVEEEIRYADRYKCNLRIDTYRKAEAIPYDSSKRIVKVQGIKNRKGAFDGDTVEIGVFDDCPPGKCYGRVLEVTERGSDLKFVCKVSYYNAIKFCPIDKKNPILTNLPGLSRVLLRKKRDEKIDKSDLESRNVVVFDPNSYDENSEEDVPLPRISQVIPFSVAKNMLFLVSFVRWKKDYPNPLGIVIGAYPKGSTLYTAERLLKFVHSVEYSPDVDVDPASVLDAERDESLRCYTRAFTIDPEEAQNLDDALSILYLDTLENGAKVYQLGVHIVNAAKHIEYGSEADKIARANGISVYGGKKGKIMHMLNDNATRCNLSLTPGKIRDVVSITCNVTINEALEICSVGSSDINSAQIKSAIQLTYEHAQDLMDGSIPTRCAEATRAFNADIANPTLHESLRLLYAVATFIRKRRLPQDASYAYDVNEPKEASCWQSHLLVEELMIWANSEVAKCIHQAFPDTALLRRQAPPNLERKQEIVRSSQSIMSCSLHLSRYLADEDITEPDSGILVPGHVLRLLERAMEDGNKTKLAHLLSFDQYYPQLAAVCSKFRSISLRAEYCCASESETDPSIYRHDSLCTDDYTHFTSPMRRYIDIEVQRLLLNLSGEQTTDFVHGKESELCLALNKKKNNAAEFEKKLKNVKLASELVENSKVCVAFISPEGKSSLELLFADLELNLPSKAKLLKISNFMPSNKDFSTEGSSFFMWQLRITTLQQDLATPLFKMSDYFSFSRPDPDKEDTVTAFYDDLSHPALNMNNLMISHPSSSLEISPTDWRKMLQFVKQPTDENMSQVREIVLKNSPTKSSSSESLQIEKKYSFLDCVVKSTLDESDVVKVWLTWSMREPVLSPTIQLVEVTPLLRVCLQHNTHPAECFSDPALQQASKEAYINIADYVDRWKTVLLAEAAESSVKDCQPVIIQDVILQWPKLEIPDKCIEEQYYVPSDSIVMKLHGDFIEHCSEFFKISVGDLICVRYGCDPHQSVQAIYHFVVHKTKEPEGNKEKKEERLIFMKPIGEMNCRVSEVMKQQLESGTYTCEIQIIQLAYSYRRVFGGLLDLTNLKMDEKKKISTLSKFVAVDPLAIGWKNGAYSKQYQETLKNYELVKSISKWSPSKGQSASLNKWQQKAMDKAIQEKFQLIQGPPGTGKSVTGARIAYLLAQLNKKSSAQGCVLYCGPSNKSVDVVFKSFVEMLSKNKVCMKILRIYSSKIERKDYPVPTDDRDAVCLPWAKPYALHHLLRQHRCGKKLDELEEKIRDMQQNRKKPNGKMCFDYRRAKADAQIAFFESEKFDVVFCTCNEAAGVRVRTTLSPKQCIIDECGMAYEPETIVPISLCEHAVLIGDHMQLQPVIEYGPAKDHGLSTSLFERYAQYYGDRICTLKRQYRMHEAICAFPSEEFYENALETDESVLRRKDKNLEGFWPRGNNCPIMFVDVVGKEGQDISSSKSETKVGIDSKYNMEEVELVMKIVKSLLQHDDTIKIEEVAILTPYSAQKNKIMERVKKEHGVLNKLKVASITESQGDEYGFVVLSTVRSQPVEEIRHRHYVQADRSWLKENLGFITDTHQINVGITRSKYGLIITGNQTLLRYDRTWKNLLEHYQKKESIVKDTHFASQP